MRRKAIIVGANGQDGRLLKSSLESQNFKVIGISREGLCPNDLLISNLDRIFDINFDLTDLKFISKLMIEFKPDCVYYLAAHHVSSEGFALGNIEDHYDDYHKVHVIGLINFLRAIIDHYPKSRLFYASSSLIFDGSHGVLQNEDTQLTPVGFYGLTKAQGQLICQHYRKKYNVFASVGILYNHESKLRSKDFLSKKIITGAHQIALGNQTNLIVGNLASRTDWGYANDFIDAFQMILNLEDADDFIVATGESHSVEEFANIVFSYFSLDYKKHIIESSGVLTRHVNNKMGDSSKLRKLTGWRPKYSFPEMVMALINDHLKSDI